MLKVTQEQIVQWEQMVKDFYFSDEFKSIEQHDNIIDSYEINKNEIAI